MGGVWNPGAAPGRLTLEGELAGAYRCRMDETRSEPAPTSELALGPYEIATLTLIPRRGAEPDAAAAATRREQAAQAVWEGGGAARR
jgi:hypothetical protein